MKYFEFLEAIHNEALSAEIIWHKDGVRVTIRAVVHETIIKQECIVTKDIFRFSNFYLKDMIENVILRRNEILNQFKNKNHGKDLQA